MLFGVLVILSSFRVQQFYTIYEILENTDKDIEQCLADTTRKIAALRSNEALMVRRYKAVEESEVMARKECAKTREEVVKIENAVMEKIGELQRYITEFFNQTVQLGQIYTIIISYKIRET